MAETKSNEKRIYSDRVWRGRTDAGLAVRVQVISIAARTEKGASGVDAILTATAAVDAALVDVNALAYVPEYFMDRRRAQIWTVILSAQYSGKYRP